MLAPVPAITVSSFANDPGRSLMETTTRQRGPSIPTGSATEPVSGNVPSLAVLATLVFGLLIRWSGHTPRLYEDGLRPVSDLINTPNVFSVIVAVLAGAWLAWSTVAPNAVPAANLLIGNREMIRPEVERVVASTPHITYDSFRELRVQRAFKTSWVFGSVLGR